MVSFASVRTVFSENIIVSFAIFFERYLSCGYVEGFMRFLARFNFEREISDVSTCLVVCQKGKYLHYNIFAAALLLHRLQWLSGYMMMKKCYQLTYTKKNDKNSVV